MKKLLFFVVVLAPLLASGCVNRGYQSPEYTRGGPPPHAPAHGYRHKHYKHDLVFDSGLGVYVVLDKLDHYFWNSHYFRYRDGEWQFATDLDGRWYRDDGSVPRKLYQSKSGAGNAKGKGKGRDKNNGKDKDRGNSDRD